jgi:hypothetical protein
MTPYLITVDIGMPGPENPELMEELEKFDENIELGESTYVVNTEKSAAEVYNTLRHFLDEKDRIYVFELGDHFAGRGPGGTIDWLNDHMHGVHHV